MTSTPPRAGASAPLRIAGAALTVYFGGGGVYTALGGNPGHLAPGMLAGTATGLTLLGVALFGRDPRVLRAAGWALGTGIAASLLLMLPALVVLGRFFGGVMPHLLTAMFVLPACYVIGLVAGGVIGWRRAGGLEPAA
jgi:hypothetical protein